MDEIKIIDFQPQYRESFRQLNYEWIQSFFELEPNDIYVLNNPEEAILSIGGSIFFVVMNDRVIGTCSIKPVNEDTVELGKMAVTKEFQSKGIGKLLLAHAISKVKVAQYKSLILYSNTQLVSAINMYINAGFRLTSKTDFHAKRTNIKMNLPLI